MGRQAMGRNPGAMPMNNPESLGSDRTPGVIVRPPLLYAGALATGAALDWLVPVDVLEPLFGGWRREIALGLIALSLALGFWAFRHFQSAGTNVPTDRPVEALVTGGPYRYSRNPIYVALTGAYLGVTVWTASLWMLALLPAVLTVMSLGVIAREEALLERLFGERYRTYRGRVRRWF